MEARVVISLTEKEECFVVALAKGLAPTRAATEAGYSIASAKPLLLKPHLAACVRHMAQNLQKVVARMDPPRNGS